MGVGGAVKFLVMGTISIEKIPLQGSCMWMEMVQDLTLLIGTTGVGGAVRFLVVGTIGKEERPPRGQCLTSLKYWPI